jgi:hypothetical protein
MGEKGGERGRWESWVEVNGLRERPRRLLSVRKGGGVRRGSEMYLRRTRGVSLVTEDAEGGR